MNNYDESSNESSDKSSDKSLDKSSDKSSDISSNISSDISNSLEENLSQINRNNFKDFSYSDIELPTDSSDSDVEEKVDPPTNKKMRTRRNRNIYRDADGTPRIERSNHMSGMVEVVGSDGLFIPENVLPTQAKYVVHAWQKKRKGTVQDAEEIEKKEREVDAEGEELSDSDFEYVAPVIVNKISDHISLDSFENIKGVCMICDSPIYKNDDLKELPDIGIIHLKCFYLVK